LLLAERFRLTVNTKVQQKIGLQCRNSVSTQKATTSIYENGEQVGFVRNAKPEKFWSLPKANKTYYLFVVIQQAQINIGFNFQRKLFPEH